MMKKLLVAVVLGAAVMTTMFATPGTADAARFRGRACHRASYYHRGWHHNHWYRHCR